MDSNTVFNLMDLINSEEEENGIIGNTEKACALISKLINQDGSPLQTGVAKIRDRLSQLLSLLDEDAFPSEMEAHRRLNRACNYLAQSKKLSLINHKVVVSLGGQFSAGKSMFINSVSGVGDLLPRAQEPTTSIPTYIIRSSKKRTSAMSVYGYAKELSNEDLEALTHEFYSTYGIGFAPFIDCIVAQSPNFSLDPSIALLDTPGYNKADRVLSERADFSDKKIAYEQLHITDYLIWLVDIESGVIQKSDIDFLHSLHLDTPILVVFTKADKVTAKTIDEVLSLAEETVLEAGLSCFGITAYSSFDHKEYNKTPILPAFFQAVASGTSHRNDILREFSEVEDLLMGEIQSAISKSISRCDELRSMLEEITNASAIRSLATLWSTENRKLHHYKTLRTDFQSAAKTLNNTLRGFLNTGGATS